LVELLVVIGIIALLIAMLLPSLNRAREQAKTVQCLSNLRQIGQAILMYANNNQGFIVPGSIRAQFYDGGSVKTEIENYASLLVSGRYLKADDDGPLTANRETGAYSVFRCPSGLDVINTKDAVGSMDLPPARNNPFGGAGAQAWAIASRSLNGQVIPSWYGMSGAVKGGRFGRYPFNTLPMDDGNRNLVKITRVRRSAEVVMLFDGIWFHHEIPNMMNRRHAGKTVNMLLGDGHAENFASNMVPANSGEDNNLKTNAYPYPKYRIDLY
jgi:prepilin-type processing-associated H-X9-DG protein